MSLFEPTSIAVVGASATEGKVGHDILSNLLTQGFAGKVFPINPKHEEILGKTSYKSVNDVPEDIDVAIVIVPAKIVPSVLEECAEKSIQNVVIISAGFGEVGTKEGDALESEVKEIANKHNMNLVGPNCLGLIRPRIEMNASFAKNLPPEGGIALVSQSGAMTVGMMDGANQVGLGFSLIASIGNKTVMDECDLLKLCAKDDATTIIGLYLESISDGKKFLETACAITPKKPIVLLKAGVTEQGKKAASSHTGALAGSDAAIGAACVQAGIHRAHTMEQCFDLLEVLSSQPVLLTPNIAIITNAGGPGILATDAAQAVGLSLPSLEKRTEDLLKKSLPKAASTSNPIDVIGDASTDRYIAALQAVGDDASIDGVCILLTPQVMTPVDEIAKAIIEWKSKYPLIPVVTSFIGDDTVRDSKDTLQKNGIPCFETPERAITSLAALLKSSHKSQVTSHEINEKRRAKVNALLEGQTGLLPEKIIKELFELYNIPLPKQSIAKSADEAVMIFKDIGGAIVAKISSPDILHKTDIGCVQANLRTEDEVRTAFEEIMINAKKQVSDESRIDGVLIQQFLEAGEEFIVGTTEDESFGHLIMVGLGGIYTELLNDTVFRVAPISMEDGYHMLQNLMSWKLLLGLRGKDQLDIDRLAALTESISTMVTECPRIKEIDLNPVLVDTDGVVVADAKVVIG